MTPDRRHLSVAVALAALAVAVATLLPEGRGWSWGSPLAELRWYAGGVGSEATMLQLVGNLGLLVPLAATAVLRWPALGRPGRLMAAALATGTGIELLQWALPLGRVVSPLDALLNATGASLAGLLVVRLRTQRRIGGPTAGTPLR